MGYKLYRYLHICIYLDLEESLRKDNKTKMAPQRRLLHLSTLVQENTAAVDACVAKSGLAEPSFEPSAPLAWDLPPDIEAARNAALEALDELREHLLGPTQNIVSRVVDVS